MKPHSEIILPVNDGFANAVNTLKDNLSVDDMNQTQEVIFNEISNDLASQLVSLNHVLKASETQQHYMDRTM